MSCTASIRLARRFHVGWTIVLFSSIVIGALAAIPIYAYVYGYTWLDWCLFGILYFVSGLRDYSRVSSAHVSSQFRLSRLGERRALNRRSLGPSKFRNQMDRRPSSSSRSLR